MIDIFSKYDLEDVDESVTLTEIPKKGLTVVVGSSGSGKSTLLRSWGMVEVSFNQEKPIIDLFKDHEEGESI